ncbi:MAG: ferredoxin family protein [Peptococcaceae bacterium]|nr:ferredoxin family protein [Peptococcaceae bacterium]
MEGFEPRSRDLNKGIFTIFPGLCKGCGLCIEKCPKQSLHWSEVLGVYGTPTVETNEDCILCGICAMVCPDTAIAITQKPRDGGEKNTEKKEKPLKH